MAVHTKHIDENPNQHNWAWSSTVVFDFAPCAVYIKPADKGGYTVEVCHYRGVKNGRIVSYWTHDKHTTFRDLILTATNRTKLWPSYRYGG